MSEEHIEFIKHCGEHFEVLTGGRGHSKTKQIIEQLQQENQQLKEVIDKAIRMLEINIEILKQQPSENKLEDEFILGRYTDLLQILNKGVKDE